MPNILSAVMAVICFSESQWNIFGVPERQSWLSLVITKECFSFFGDETWPFKTRTTATMKRDIGSLVSVDKIREVRKGVKSSEVMAEGRTLSKSLKLLALICSKTCICPDFILMRTNQSTFLILTLIKYVIFGIVYIWSPLSDQRGLIKHPSYNWGDEYWDDFFFNSIYTIVSSRNQGQFPTQWTSGNARRYFW